MPLTVEDLFATPDHYLHSFDGDGAVFMPMDRAAYHRSIFLDHRISPAFDQRMTLPVGMLASRPPAAAPTSWIFHMAHCGSTLLARALDDPAASLVLREPLGLRQMGLLPDADRLNIVLAMLGKRYRHDSPTLVKANVPVNFLLPQLTQADPAAASIFLYLPLRAYLLAVLRNDAHRNWVRKVTGQLKAHLGDLSSASDAERAATLWVAQVEAFAQALSVMPNAATLDAETFFADPVETLQRAARYLGVPISDTTIEAIAAGPLFSTYSKNPTIVFDNSARMARAAAIERELGPEIAEAETWVAGRTTVPMPEARLVQRALSR